ncbi:hypothetical protein [Chryseobacterium sp. LAM-KRS1]|uniref:hypothetical protein n=1 Tax=Chryseobacterium sp. LAM-KRS1 TaxID=2715754 RepID=UPI001553D041|nr:hypothetical protein [Chryseobacterium sp. LAM-KRS1]
MKTKMLFLSSILLFEMANAQIGIGTPNPRGALDINKPTTNDHGLVLPTNSSTSNISNPMGGEVAIGTIMYDSTEDCVKVYKSKGWSQCLGEGINQGFVLDCSSGTLTGTYTQSTPSSGTKTINYTGASGQSYNAISVASTGVTGLTASAPAGTLTNGNGTITLTISGTPSGNGNANFTINIAGQTCTFIINIGQPQARTIRVLSIIPDAWNSNLSDGRYSNVARSKLRNTSNFGPSGKVKITGFTFDTFNIYSGSPQELEYAINNADIIWIGYVNNSYFTPEKRRVLDKKIREKKKFFFIGNDNYNGGYFPAKTSFAGHRFDYFRFGTLSTDIISTTNGPDKGVFGNLPDGSPISMYRAIGKITNYPSDSTPFIMNTDGTINAVSSDNLVVVSDTNWYTSNESADGFYRGSRSCSDNNNSVLFCNIFEKAVQYVLTH